MLVYRIMLALMRGEFADTERLIVQSMALLRPRLAAHADQLSMQIFTLRREQGRLGGLQSLVSAFLQQGGRQLVWRPGLALLYLELGQREAARAVFEELAAEDFATMPRDGRWLFCMVYLSEVCAALGDAARAAELYRLLLPYAGRNTFGAASCLLRIGRPVSRTALRRDGPLGRGGAAFRGGPGDECPHRRPLPLAHTRHDYADDAAGARRARRPGSAPPFCCSEA